MTATCDVLQCVLLIYVDSYEPVHPLFKLRKFKNDVRLVA